MARDIPLDRALSDDDRRYLRQRGSYGESMERRVDAAFAPDPEALAAFNAAEQAANAVANGTDATGAGAELVRTQARVAELEAQLAALQSGGQEPVDYSGWNKAQLEAEVDRINAEDADAKLAKGTKEQMIAGLTAYFDAD